MRVVKMKPSHVPVLVAVINIFQPKSCIEFGSGLYSTDILSKIEDFITIEHGKEWGDKALGEYGKEKVKILPLKFAYNVYPRDIKVKTINAIMGMYRKIIKSVDLCFIDTYAATRFLALTAMWGRFKIAVLHDTQNVKYRYQPVIEALSVSGSLQIQCKPTNGDPWTDIIIPNPFLGIDATTAMDSIQSKEYPFKFAVKAWL